METRPEMLALLGGLVFSVAVFAFKAAVGEYYLLAGTPKRGRAVFAVVTLAYLALWIAALAVTGPGRGGVLSVLRDPRWFAGGTALHLFAATGFFIWGALLLAGGEWCHRSRGGWFLALPCPVCAGAILLSAAFGSLLFPEQAGLIRAGMPIWFFAVQFATLAVLRHLTRRAGMDEHRLTGQLMIFVGLYFAGLVFLVPNFDRVEAMYRVAAGTAFVLPPGVGYAFAGLLAVLLAGWAKERFFNKG